LSVQIANFLQAIASLQAKQIRNYAIFKPCRKKLFCSLKYRADDEAEDPETEGDDRQNSQY
jgi:L-rhamnose mutarotase